MEAKLTVGQDSLAWRRWHDEDTPVRVGISACLLGEQVRYDGGHKRDPYLTDVLGQWVTWAAVCPEVEVGMPVPRPTIRLQQDGDQDRLIEPVSKRDHTRSMFRFARRRIGELRREGLDGFVLKRGSPSCGMAGVKVWAAAGASHKRGAGHFARRLMEDAPSLPVEEEGRLVEARRRDHFVERLFCGNRWRVMVRRRVTRRRLASFHAAHDMLLRSHDTGGCRTLGRLVEQLGARPDRDVFSDYESVFATTLARRPTVKKHVSVMRRLAAQLKSALDPTPMRRIDRAIEDYGNHSVPLSVPQALLRHEVHALEIDGARDQLYLDPHPQESMLRHHP